MKSVWFTVKLVGAVLGSVILIVVLYFTLAIVRKSVPFVFSSDVEELAASGPYNSEGLATEICGTPVDILWCAG